MAICTKCGSPLKFRQMASGRWCPRNPDGTDHWDLCKALQSKAGGRPKVVFHARTGGNGFVWCGDMPPWHTSLGDFREYTDAEMQAQEVCFYRKSA